MGTGLGQLQADFETLEEGREQFLEFFITGMLGATGDAVGREDGWIWVHVRRRLDLVATMFLVRYADNLWGLGIVAWGRT